MKLWVHPVFRTASGNAQAKGPGTLTPYTVILAESKDKRFDSALRDIICKKLTIIRSKVTLTRHNSHPERSRRTALRLRSA